LNLPLASARCYWAIAPLYIFASVLLFARLVGSPYQSAVVLCLASSSLLFWELLVTGHDLVPLGFAFAVLTLATWKLSQSRKPEAIAAKRGLIPRDLLGPILLGMIVGAVATSRVVFAPFPLLLALLAWKNDRKFALLLAGVGIVVAGLLHGYFYRQTVGYQPLHLLLPKKCGGAGLMRPAMVAEAIVVVYIYLHAGRDPAQWLRGVALALIVPLTFVAVGRLRAGGWDLSQWEEANYLFAGLPCYLFYVAARMFPAAGAAPPPPDAASHRG
jgi:hypothetical protein